MKKAKICFVILLGLFLGTSCIVFVRQWRCERWKRQSPQETLVEVQQEVPTWFDVKLYKQYVFVASSNRMQEVIDAVNLAEERASSFLGKGNTPAKYPIRIYYLNTTDEYLKLYEELEGRKPGSYGGICCVPKCRVFVAAISPEAGR